MGKQIKYPFPIPRPALGWYTERQFKQYYGEASYMDRWTAAGRKKKKQRVVASRHFVGAPIPSSVPSATPGSQPPVVDLTDSPSPQTAADAAAAAAAAAAVAAEAAGAMPPP